MIDFVWFARRLFVCELLDFRSKSASQSPSRDDIEHEEGFAGRLEALVNAFHVAGEAQFMDDFASGAYIPTGPIFLVLLETNFSQACNLEFEVHFGGLNPHPHMLLMLVPLICEVVKPEMDLLLEAFTVPPPSALEQVLKDLFYAGIVALCEARKSKISFNWRLTN